MRDLSIDVEPLRTIINRELKHSDYDSCLGQNALTDNKYWTKDTDNKYWTKDTKKINLQHWREDKIREIIEDRQNFEGNGIGHVAQSCGT